MSAPGRDVTTAAAPPASHATRPRVVIVGGGFGGLQAARALRRAEVDVTLVDRTNHHLFQPLLYQVATAVLAPSDIASPIRFLLRRAPNTRVLLGDVVAVDPDRRELQLDDGEIIPYDYLLLAPGSRHAYFGHPEWEPLAPGLKDLEDARDIRRRFLLAFEEAEKLDDPAEREPYLTFVIVGGGPTGVELAGMIPDIARHSMRADFRRVDTGHTRVILLEGGPRILATFDPDLSARAHRDLEELGVDVRTGSLVTRIERDAVYVGDERIPTRTVFWAAGNVASPLGKMLGAPVDRVGRVQVNPDLSVPGRPEVFIAGDLATIQQADGSLVPGVAPAAMQEGVCAARNIVRAIHGEPGVPFHYRDKGNLATIGRHRAVAEFGRLRLAGPLAWWFWLFVHILYLAGFRNRLSVLLEWGYSYLTYRRGARLIGEERAALTHGALTHGALTQGERTTRAHAAEPVER
ncbi:MAG TPA: NAD(P)/FAD-dependent oxidoreductase [Gemmatimonadaceae bacterium]|nr:NAD(P)/FAD-dependent oxidoreductase [Gemmatimonadaceae bacterium]